MKYEQQAVAGCRLGSTEGSNTSEGGAAKALPGGPGLWQHPAGLSGTGGVRNCYTGLLWSSNVFININEQKLG